MLQKDPVGGHFTVRELLGPLSALGHPLRPRTGLSALEGLGESRFPRASPPAPAPASSHPFPAQVFLPSKAPAEVSFPFPALEPPPPRSYRPRRPRRRRPSFSPPLHLPLPCISPALVLALAHPKTPQAAAGDPNPSLPSRLRVPKPHSPRRAARRRGPNSRRPPCTEVLKPRSR